MAEKHFTTFIKRQSDESWKDERNIKLPLLATTGEIKSRHICWECVEWNKTWVPSSVTLGEKWLSPIRTANLSASRCCSVCERVCICARKVSTASINFDGERRHYIACSQALASPARPRAHAASNWNLCLSPAHTIFHVINFYLNTSPKSSPSMQQFHCQSAKNFAVFAQAETLALSERVPC